MKMTATEYLKVKEPSERTTEPSPKKPREDLSDKVHVTPDDANMTAAAGDDAGNDDSADLRVPIHIRERLSSRDYLQSNKFDA